MIAPRPRLLFWTALAALPAFTAALQPELEAPLVGAILLLAAVAAGDAWLGRRRVRQLAAALPESVRMTVDRPADIPLTMRNTAAGGRTVAVGLPLPSEFRSADELVEVRLPEAAGESRLAWPCTPRRRGRYAIDCCWFQTASPLGFWDARSSSPGRLEIRVYPNLAQERRRLSALFLRRRQLGMHVQRMVGHGREFEKLREYMPGDLYEDIHWKASARRGRPISKLFQIERTREIYVLLDTSRLSARPLGAGPALERQIAAALVLGLVAEQQGDLFGLLTFNDQVRRFIRAGRGRAHYNVCRDAIYGLESSPATPDFADLTSFTRLRLRKRALLLLITDLSDPVLSESFLRSMELICRQHLVMVFMIRPPGVRDLFAAPVGDAEDEIYQALGGHYFQHDLRELGNALRRKGVEFLLTEQESLCGDMISSYLRVKARQVL
jgi:uncharacterized protein (DUF58 family)